MRRFGFVLAVMLAPGMVFGALAADTVKKDQSILDRLYANTGVYNKSPTGKTPNFVSDPGWPAPLPRSARAACTIAATRCRPPARPGRWP